MLLKVIENPSLLIGCKVKLKLKEYKNDEAEWCDAEVIGIHKENEVSRKTVYNVRYFGDNPDDVYHMPLLLDMRKKELVILVESSNLLENSSSYRTEFHILCKLYNRLDHCFG